MEQFLRPVVSSYTGNSITGKLKDLVLLLLHLKERKKEEAKKKINTIEEQQKTANLQKRKYKQFSLLEALDLGSRYIFTLRPIYNKLIL